MAIDRLSSLIAFSSYHFMSKCVKSIVAAPIDPTGTINSPTSEKNENYAKM